MVTLQYSMKQERFSNVMVTQINAYRYTASYNLQAFQHKLPGNRVSRSHLSVWWLSDLVLVHGVNPAEALSKTFRCCYLIGYDSTPAFRRWGSALPTPRRLFLIVLHHGYRYLPSLPILSPIPL